MTAATTSISICIINKSNKINTYTHLYIYILQCVRACMYECKCIKCNDFNNNDDNDDDNTAAIKQIVCLDTHDLQKMPILAKKISFPMKLILILAVMETSKIVAFGVTENPHAYIEKPTHPKGVTVWCGFWSRGIMSNFSSKMSKKRPLQSTTIVIGQYGTNFYLQNLRKRILATLGFNRTALHPTQPMLHSIFCDLFLKIALSAAELMSFSHLAAAICHRWTIICGVPSKISVTPRSQRQLLL